MISQLKQAIRNICTQQKSNENPIVPKHFITMLSIVASYVFIITALNLSKSDSIAFANSISSILLTNVAFSGFSIWKKQISWQRKTKAAEDFILLYYKSKDALMATISMPESRPFPYSKKTYPIDIAQETISKKYATLNQFSNIFAELESRMHEFRIILGDDAYGVIGKILHLKKALKYSFRLYVEHAQVYTNALINANDDSQLINDEPAREKYLALAENFKEHMKSEEIYIFDREDSPINKGLIELENHIKAIQARFLNFEQYPHP